MHPSVPLSVGTNYGIYDEANFQLNLNYFTRPFHVADHQVQDYTNMMLSWSQFSKEPLPDRNFTFWEWFYAIMKVTREHLRGLWNDR